MKLLRILFFLGGSIAVLSLAACESVKFNSDDHEEGIQPWARPEPWESQAGMGGMFPGTR